jgi:hypothetical protein
MLLLLFYPDGQSRASPSLSNRQKATDAGVGMQRFCGSRQGNEYLLGLTDLISLVIAPSPAINSSAPSGAIQLLCLVEKNLEFS